MTSHTGKQLINLFISMRSYVNTVPVGNRTGDPLGFLSGRLFICERFILWTFDTWTVNPKIGTHYPWTFYPADFLSGDSLSYGHLILGHLILKMDI